jgi:hypothetical protein
MAAEFGASRQTVKRVFAQDYGMAEELTPCPGGSEMGRMPGHDVVSYTGLEGIDA